MGWLALRVGEGVSPGPSCAWNAFQLPAASLGPGSGIDGDAARSPCLPGTGLGCPVARCETVPGDTPSPTLRSSRNGCTPR